MDAVGAEVIPSHDQLRAALEQPPRGASGPMRLLERVLGFELKLRQYRDGKRFCDAVVQRAGIEGLNRVWSGPPRPPHARRAGRSGQLAGANGCSDVTK